MVDRKSDRYIRKQHSNHRNTMLRMGIWLFGHAVLRGRVAHVAALSWYPLHGPLAPCYVGLLGVGPLTRLSRFRVCLLTLYVYTRNGAHTCTYMLAGVGFLCHWHSLIGIPWTACGPSKSTPWICMGLFWHLIFAGNRYRYYRGLFMIAPILKTDKKKSELETPR